MSRIVHLNYELDVAETENVSKPKYADTTGHFIVVHKKRK